MKIGGPLDWAFFVISATSRSSAAAAPYRDGHKDEAGYLASEFSVGQMRDLSLLQFQRLVETLGFLLNFKPNFSPSFSFWYPFGELR